MVCWEGPESFPTIRGIQSEHTWGWLENCCGRFSRCQGRTFAMEGHNQKIFFGPSELPWLIIISPLKSFKIAEFWGTGSPYLSHWNNLSYQLYQWLLRMVICESTVSKDLAFSNQRNNLNWTPFPPLLWRLYYNSTLISFNNCMIMTWVIRDYSNSSTNNHN